MNAYRIENTTSGLVLGTYEANSESGALEALAADAGYRSYGDMIDAVGGDDDLAVTEIR